MIGRCEDYGVARAVERTRRRDDCMLRTMTRHPMRERSGRCTLLWLPAVAVGALLFVCFGCVGDDPGPTGAGSTETASCQEYCDAVLVGCTGPLRAYDNAGQCLATCALMAPGKVGDRGNTVACRLPHAKAGSGRQTCMNASAYGGGVCGDRCDAFCELVDKNCIAPLGAAAPYASKPDCVEACQKIRYDSTGVEGPGQAFDGEDTLNCRMFHLILSLDDRVGHCPHTAVQSATCRSRDGGASDGG
jgi:hypothetical protein